MFRNLIYFLLTGIIISGCAASKGLKSRDFKEIIDESPVFSEYFTGFMLYDPETDEVLYAKNEDKYFTPASNTKLFTFYAGLNILGDSIPGLHYVIRNDSLIFWGSGDPTFLNPDMSTDRVYNFLKSRPERLYFSPSNFYSDHFGPGWSWNWYNYYFATEKSPFPIYGDFVRFTKQKGDSVLLINPQYFADYYEQIAERNPFGQEVERDMDKNEFTYAKVEDTLEFEIDVPYRYSPDLFTKLLADTLGRFVEVVDIPLPEEYKTINSIPSDSVYKRLLQVSDNFFAEQIMLMNAGKLSDSLDTDIAIEYAVDNLIDDLPDEPVWYDGSGLSKYNLFTPRSVVRLLLKIRSQVEMERLMAMLPAGGMTGTIKYWYTADEPYIYAKTGTLSNVLALSGFLITKSGKTLVFSWLHNNHNFSSSRIKREMEKVLVRIRDAY